VINTVHIDIEGGWGGSSRSLYELISRLDRKNFNPIVIHRKKGPIEEKYRAINIPTVHIPEIVSFAPRKKKSTKIFLGTIPKMFGFFSSIKKIRKVLRHHNADIIHLNYEGLFMLAFALYRINSPPIVCHCRTVIPYNIWGKWMTRVLGKNVMYMFFISPIEKLHFRRLESNLNLPGKVIWNIASQPINVQNNIIKPEIVYLGMINYQKGVDRLIDIAAKLDSINAPKLCISVYGRASNDLKYEKQLKRRIKQDKLGHRIRLCGHTNNPIEKIITALALIRPSRDNDPWGRDVIEATSLGVPVIATGKYEGVIKHGINGFLFDKFDSMKIAKQLVELLKNPKLRNSLSNAGILIGKEKFSGLNQIKEISTIISKLSRKDYGIIN